MSNELINTKNVSVWASGYICVCVPGCIMQESNYATIIKHMIQYVQILYNIQMPDTIIYIEQKIYITNDENGSKNSANKKRHVIIYPTLNHEAVPQGRVAFYRLHNSPVVLILLLMFVRNLIFEIRILRKFIG